MGGRKKPEGDRLRGVRPELHEKPSSREALRRLVSILAKDDATARDIEALAKKEGIEKLTREARRLGLLDPEPPSVRAIDRAVAREVKEVEGALFKREMLAEFPSYSDVESKPFAFEDMFEDMEDGLKKSKAAMGFLHAGDRGVTDDPSDARRVPITRRHGKTAAEEARKKFVAGLSKMSTVSTPRRSPGFFGRPSVDPPIMAARWEWGLITCVAFLAYLRRYSKNFDVHDWGHFRSIRLGSALEATEMIITEEEQRLRCEANVGRLGGRLRERLLTAVTEGDDPFQEFDPHTHTVWLDSEIETLSRDAFTTKAFTIRHSRLDYDDTENIQLRYQPLVWSDYIAINISFNRHSIRSMHGSRTPHPDPRANLPEGPPEAMNDRDFASVFQNWIKSDE